MTAGFSRIFRENGSSLNEVRKATSPLCCPWSRRLLSFINYKTSYIYHSVYLLFCCCPAAPLSFSSPAPLLGSSHARMVPSGAVGYGSFVRFFTVLQGILHLIASAMVKWFQKLVNNLSIHSFPSSQQPCNSNLWRVAGIKTVTTVYVH